MEELLSQIETNEQRIKEATAILEPLVEENKRLRDELKQSVRVLEKKSHKTPNNRYTVSLAVRRDVKVVDELMVRTYLQSNGLLEECLRLDQFSLKRYAKVREIPGMEEVETEVLTVSEVKNKVEAIPEEESVKEFSQRVNQPKA